MRTSFIGLPGIRADSRHIVLIKCSEECSWDLPSFLILFLASAQQDLTSFLSHTSSLVGHTELESYQYNAIRILIVEITRCTW